MYTHPTLEQNRNGWNTISAQYQATTRISTTDVHYGPLAHGERELGLLGEVAGQRVLEIGCGGGQNSIALSKWGAACVGLDPSDAQLQHARRLAREEGVDVSFLQGVAEDLSAFPDQSFHTVLSSYAFGYVTDLPRAYAETWRVLQPGGLFVFCLTHPWFHAVGWYLGGEPDAPEVADYAAWPGIEEWDWSFEDGTTAPMKGHLHTLQHLVNTLLEAGFVLERLVEQQIEDVGQATPEELARLPYVSWFDAASDLYRIMRKLPLTLILRGRKAHAQPARER